MGKNLESACKAWHHAEATKIENRMNEITDEIFFGETPLLNHPLLAEFATLQRRLLDLGAGK